MKLRNSGFGNQLVDNCKTDLKSIVNASLLLSAPLLIDYPNHHY